VANTILVEFMFTVWRKLRQSVTTNAIVVKEVVSIVMVIATPTLTANPTFDPP